MHTSQAKIAKYVDKQVRKELREAIRTGDLRLLENFLDSFSGVQSRLAMHVNRKEEPHGDTLLHYATLMDYRRGEPLAPNDGLKVAEYQLNYIRQRAKHEPAQSLEVKCKMIELLLAKGGADP